MPKPHYTIGKKPPLRRYAERHYWNRNQKRSEYLPAFKAKDRSHPYYVRKQRNKEKVARQTRATKAKQLWLLQTAQMLWDQGFTGTGPQAVQYVRNATYAQKRQKAAERRKPSLGYQRSRKIAYRFKSRGEK